MLGRSAESANGLPRTAVKTTRRAPGGQSQSLSTSASTRSALARNRTRPIRAAWVDPVKTRLDIGVQHPLIAAGTEHLAVAYWEPRGPSVAHYLPVPFYAPGWGVSGRYCGQ